MVIDHPIFLESIRFIRSRLVANDLNYLEKKVSIELNSDNKHYEWIIKTKNIFFWFFN